MILEVGDSRGKERVWFHQKSEISVAEKKRIREKLNSQLRGESWGMKIGVSMG